MPAVAEPVAGEILQAFPRQVATAACDYLDGLDVTPEHLIPTALVTRADLADDPAAD